MINSLNIDIYNYIFSINVNIQNRVNTCSEETNIKRLIYMIENNYNINEFWKENKDMFNEECLQGHQYIIEKEYTYDIKSFPRLKSKSKLEFLNFKLEEFKKIIENNGMIERKQLDVIFENIEDLGRKEILEYCKKENIIDYDEEKTFLKGGQTGLAMIWYDSIKPVIKSTIKEKMNMNPIYYSQNIYGNNYGTVQQNNSLNLQNDKLIEVVLDKLKAMEAEGISKDKIEEINTACNERNSKKVIAILKEIALGTGTNLMANAILMMFGLM